MALVTAITRTEIAWLFILSGLIAVAAYAPPRPAGGEARQGRLDA